MRRVQRVARRRSAHRGGAVADDADERWREMERLDAPNRRYDGKCRYSAHRDD